MTMHVGAMHGTSLAGLACICGCSVALCLLVYYNDSSGIIYLSSLLTAKNIVECPFLHFTQTNHCPLWIFREGHNIILLYMGNY